MSNSSPFYRKYVQGVVSKANAKIAIPAPSARSFSTTLPEFQPHFHALKPQNLIIGLAQPSCD